MLRSNSKQSGESMWSILKKKGRLRRGGFAEKEDSSTSDFVIMHMNGRRNICPKQLTTVAYCRQIWHRIFTRISI